MITRTGVKPRCDVCRHGMHKTLSGAFECRRAACGKPAKPIKAKRAKPRKTTVMRDRKYLDWLKTRRCVVCDCSPLSMDGLFAIIDPAHGPSAGMRVKGPDKEACPLCRHHHSEQHSIGWPDFEAKYKIDREREAAIHYGLYLLLRD